MGASKEKASSTTVVNQTTKPTPTPEETAMNQLMLQQQQAINAPQTESMLNGFSLMNQMLTGGQLPGLLAGVPSGITGMGSLGQTPNVSWQNIDPNKGVIGEDYTNQLVQQSLRDLYPQFQSGGILDSGVAASIAGRTSGDIRQATAQSNLERQLAIMEANRTGQAAVDESNINRQLGASQFDLQQQYSNKAFNAQQLLNLLNLTIGAPAQIQQPVLAQNQMLNNNLQGLRSTNTQGTTQTNSMTKNPFLTGSDIMGGVGAGIGTFAALAAACWVAKEIFGSWEHPKTIQVRYYIGNIAPKWFKNFYLEYGERIADFIHDKPLFKLALKPLFELFAALGKQGAIYARS